MQTTVTTSKTRTFIEWLRLFDKPKPKCHGYKFETIYDLVNDTVTFKRINYTGCI